MGLVISDYITQVLEFVGAHLQYKSLLVTLVSIVRLSFVTLSSYRCADICHFVPHSTLHHRIFLLASFH